jgi:hypothetical protein
MSIYDADQIEDALAAKDKLIAALDASRSHAWIEAEGWFDRYIDAAQRCEELRRRLQKAGVPHV